MDTAQAAQLVLALVALVNAIGTAAALIIQALGGIQRPRSETHTVSEATQLPSSARVFDAPSEASTSSQVQRSAPPQRLGMDS